eukprot:CAMPEP_0119301874 /NCGR_PEP_ID=MMETSP1333-20130426/3586_1 /TAXON_ID=418940 /ORGANISM="Scyphosphaera apsteinii, Strain RCC1455" /LENGTH=91 /DNA_ID=CAMNT_0007304077 /DNA_START=191 /DNA_END=466 /DNA_ORIENTATION=-
MPLEHEEGTESDPWTPCQKPGAGGVTHGFCRLSCTAKWSFAPDRMDCLMLPKDALLQRSYAKGAAVYRELSTDSHSKVNSGVSSDPNDPDI